MTMEANELMIGDWVNCPKLKNDEDDGNMRIKQLYCADLDCDSFKELKYSEIQPIPLTPEILEKNFYKKCVITNGMEIDTRFKPYHITEQLYVHNGICGTMVCCSDGGSKLSPLFECKYVHQLQHILKASGILNEIVL